MSLVRLLGRKRRAPQTQPRSLDVDGLVYELRWSTRRRTVEIAIDARGRLRLAAPSGCAPSFLVEFARRKRPWVDKHLAARAARGPVPAAPTFGEGDRLPCLGEPLPLHLVDRRRPILELVDGRFELSREAAGKGCHHFVRWARRHASAWIGERVERIAGEVGRAPIAVAVREMGRRWGSCARDGRIAFNWRLILLDPALVDYVIVHELAHLAEHHHGPAFWRLVECDQPDFRARRRALRHASVEIGWTWD